MIIFFHYIFILFLSFTCESSSVEDKTMVWLSLDTEKYSMEEEDKKSPDNSDRNDSIGALERRLIEAGLVNIKEIIPQVWVDLKYSTTDNFFKKDVYGILENCYVQPVVAEMLQKAHNELEKEHPGLTFLIFDGVRPLSVQQILWDNLDKPEKTKPLYVADPKKGSLHNFGVAVDLTLVEKSTGEELDMGTGYDFFGYPAYPDREDQMMREGKITAQQVANRKILRKVMFAAGFEGIGSEWWHFNAFTRKVAGEKFVMVE